MLLRVPGTIAIVRGAFDPRNRISRVRVAWLIPRNACLYHDANRPRWRSQMRNRDACARRFAQTREAEFLDLPGFPGPRGLVPALLPEERCFARFETSRHVPPDRSAVC